MAFAAKHSVPVNHTVSGYFRFYVMSAVHGPAYHSRRTFCAQACSDSTIGGNPSFRDLPGHFIHQFKKDSSLLPEGLSEDNFPVAVFLSFEVSIDVIP